MSYAEKRTALNSHQTRSDIHLNLTRTSGYTTVGVVVLTGHRSLSAQNIP